MALITIETSGSAPRTEQARAWCERLEAGDILYFPQTPISFRPQDLSFLLGQEQTGSTLHKNIAYKPNLDSVSGLDAGTAGAEELKQLQTIMRQYSQDVTRFLTHFLSPYQGRWNWTTPASARRKRKGETCRCAAATTCCTPTLSLPVPRGERASYASSTIFTQRARATGW